MQRNLVFSRTNTSRNQLNRIISFNASIKYFDVLLTVNLSIILAINQINAQILVFL